MVEKCRKRDGIMAKVSKTKEYATRYLKEVIGMEYKQIAKELNMTQEVVRNILGEESPHKANIKTTSSKTDSFIRETAVKKTKNVTIMTEPASQAGDDQENKINPKYEKVIYRPRG
jgi:predicted transcriptional regulator